MFRPMVLRVIDSVFLYSVFAIETSQKGADMGTRIIISRIDHTPKALRKVDPGRNRPPVAGRGLDPV